MFYDDKRWDRKRDVDSLESLIAWLEQQPADATYKYTDTGNGTVGCVLCQYYRAHGVSVWAMERNHRHSYQGERIPLPQHFNEVAIGRLYRTFGDHYQTFGNALATARAIAQERPRK